MVDEPLQRPLRGRALARAASLAVAVALAGVPAGCYRPDLDGCRIACGAGGECPAGLACGADGLCAGARPCLDLPDGTADPADGAPAPDGVTDPADGAAPPRDGRPLDAAFPLDASPSTTDGGPAGPWIAVTLTVAGGPGNILAGSFPVQPGDVVHGLLIADTATAAEHPAFGGTCPSWSGGGITTGRGVSRSSAYCQVPAGMSSVTVYPVFSGTPVDYVLLLTLVRGTTTAPVRAGGIMNDSTTTGTFSIGYGAALRPAGALLLFPVGTPAPTLAATPPAAGSDEGGSVFTNAGAMNLHLLSRRVVDPLVDEAIEGTTTPSTQLVGDRLVFF